MNHVVASSLLPKKCASTLTEAGFSIIYLPPWELLQKGVSGHPDMLFFPFRDTYVCSKSYYELAKDSFSLINKLGYTPILTDEMPSPEYPNDVLFNCLHLGNSIYGLRKATSKRIIELAGAHSLDFVNVRQGYTKCSVFKLSDNAIITSDASIAKAAKARGVDVLVICEGGIRLDGYGFGFIGGTGGVCGDNAYFCGDLYLHPDSKAIVNFCEKHKKRCICLSEDILFDIGSLFFI